MKQHLLFLSIFLIALNVFAHGSAVPDDVRAGPNRGFVKRAGAFTIETVLDKDGSLRVFLLDMALKNPVVQNSSIEIVLEQGKQKDFFSCETVENNYFHCMGIEKLSLSKGALAINAKRTGTVGRVRYDLPLKVSDPSAPLKHDDHSGH